MFSHRNQAARNPCGLDLMRHFTNILQHRLGCGWFVLLTMVSAHLFASEKPAFTDYFQRLEQ